MTVHGSPMPLSPLSLWIKPCCTITAAHRSFIAQSSLRASRLFAFPARFATLGVSARIGFPGQTRSGVDYRAFDSPRRLVHFCSREAHCPSPSCPRPPSLKLLSCSFIYPRCIPRCDPRPTQPCPATFFCCTMSRATRRSLRGTNLSAVDSAAASPEPSMAAFTRCSQKLVAIDSC